MIQRTLIVVVVAMFFVTGLYQLGRFGEAVIRLNNPCSETRP